MGRDAHGAGLPRPAFRARAPFDLIVANILARPLMSLAPEMARYVTPGGSVILSGILERQRNAVLAAYGGQKFRHVQHALARRLGNASPEALTPAVDVLDVGSDSAAACAVRRGS